MTKAELHNKHGVTLLKPEGISLVQDIAHYLRMMTPIAPPNAEIDQTIAVRRSGWLDAWIACANVVMSVHVPEKQQAERPTGQPYVEPQNKVPTEPRPPVPLPADMPNFVKPADQAK